MRQSVTYKEKSEGFANQTFRLLLVGRSRSGFSSPDSDTNYTLGLAVETITESSMASPAGFLFESAGRGRHPLQLHLAAASRQSFYLFTKLMPHLAAVIGSSVVFL